MQSLFSTEHQGLFGGTSAKMSGKDYFGGYFDFLTAGDWTTTTPSYTSPDWTVTLVNSCLAVLQSAGNGFGGVLKLTNSGAASDAQQFQLNQEVCMCYGPGTTQYPQVGGLDMHFEVRCAIGSLTNMDVAFGFAKTGTTQIVTVPSDSIAMRKYILSTGAGKNTFNLDARIASSAYAGADATSFFQVPDTQFHTYYIQVEPYNDLSTGRVKVTVDGNPVFEWKREDGNQITLPQVSLAPFFAIHNNDTTAPTTTGLVVQLEHLAFAQRRYRSPQNF